MAYIDAGLNILSQGLAGIGKTAKDAYDKSFEDERTLIARAQEKRAKAASERALNQQDLVNAASKNALLDFQNKKNSQMEALLGAQKTNTAYQKDLEAAQSLYKDDIQDFSQQPKEYQNAVKANDAKWAGIQNEYVKQANLLQGISDVSPDLSIQKDLYQKMVNSGVDVGTALTKSKAIAAQYAKTPLTDTQKALRDAEIEAATKAYIGKNNKNSITINNGGTGGNAYTSRTIRGNHPKTVNAVDLKTLIDDVSNSAWAYDPDILTKEGGSKYALKVLTKVANDGVYTASELRDGMTLFLNRNKVLPEAYKGTLTADNLRKVLAKRREETDKGLITTTTGSKGVSAIDTLQAQAVRKAQFQNTLAEIQNKYGTGPSLNVGLNKLAGTVQKINGAQPLLKQSHKGTITDKDTKQGTSSKILSTTTSTPKTTKSAPPAPSPSTPEARNIEKLDRRYKRYFEHKDTSSMSPREKAAFLRNKRYLEKKMEEAKKRQQEKKGQ